MVFDNLAVFTGAAFGDATKFDDSVFNGWVLFNGKSKEKRTAELGASPELGVRHQEAWNGPDRFLSISFSGVRFHGEVNFSGRSFERTADFTNTQFLFRNFPPDFDSATNLSRIDFAGAHTGARPITFFPSDLRPQGRESHPRPSKSRGRGQKPRSRTRPLYGGTQSTAGTLLRSTPRSFENRLMPELATQHSAAHSQFPWIIVMRSPIMAAVLCAHSCVGSS